MGSGFRRGEAEDREGRQRNMPDSYLGKAAAQPWGAGELKVVSSQDKRCDSQ